MKRSLEAVAAIVLVALGALPALAALDIEPDAVYVRVIDTGAGLCTITRMPGGHYMVYDAGHWHYDTLCLEGVAEVVPQGESIDLMVLSHSDADHLAAVDEIFDAYSVERVLRTGHSRWLKATWRDAYWAIRRAREAGTTTDVNLWSLPNKQITPGFTNTYGDTEIVQLSGFNEAPSNWDLKNRSERRNAISIVVRLEFAGRSILYAGDAVGRHIGDDDSACLGTEKYLVDNASQVPLASEVLIAPHHGADNGSSRCFIDAVAPDWVIFAAGHEHEHPRARTAARYLAAGVAEANILRTDRGDYEGGDEWLVGAGAGDGPGDDDIEILIRPSGEILVAYR